MKPIYEEKIKICHMNTDSFIIYIKANDTYVDIAKDVETRFDILNFALDRPLHKRKNKKLIR